MAKVNNELAAQAATGALPRVRTQDLAKNMAICMVVPMGDPMDPDCMRGATPIYWGKPGIGKSAIARTAARSALLHLETLYPATRNPEDFSGITVPDPNSPNGLRTICGLAAVRRLLARKEGVLFIDEASGAPPAVQSAMLSLILERNVGDEILPPRIRIMAAANPVDCAAGGWDFEAPTANRFLHFEVPPPANTEWLKWYMSENTPVINPTDSLWDIVEKNWGTAYPRAKGLVAGFIQKMGGTLHMLPGEEDPQRSRAWPSPRTWDVAGRCMATLFALNEEALLDVFVQAAVGEGATTSFLEWKRSANLPSPEDMLTHGWKPDRLRLDISIGALTGMTQYVIQNDNPKKYAAAAWKILEDCCNVGITDLAMESTKSLVQAGLSEEDLDGQILEAARPVIRRLSKSPLANLLGMKP